MSTVHPFFGKLTAQGAWNYRLEFALNSLSGLGADAAETLTLNASDCTCALLNTPEIPIPFINLDAKMPGRVVIAPMTCTLIEAYNKDAADVIERWHKLVVNPRTGEMGLMEDFLADGYVIILYPNRTVYKTYEVKGCFPTDPGAVTRGWPNAAYATRQVTFSVNEVWPPSSQ